jgi:hypothetical protein
MESSSVNPDVSVDPPVSSLDAFTQTLLLCLAQLGLGLAGFGGLISAFKPDLEQKSLRVQGALRLLLEHAFALVILALFPLLLYHIGLKHTKIWRVSSALLVAFFLAEGSFQAGRAVDREEVHASAIQIYLSSVFLVRQWASFSSLRTTS